MELPNKFKKIKPNKFGHWRRKVGDSIEYASTDFALGFNEAIDEIRIANNLK